MPRIYKRAEHFVDDGATDVRPCDQDGATNAPTQGSSLRKSRAKGYHDESCDWQGPQVTRRSASELEAQAEEKPQKAFPTPTTQPQICQMDPAPCLS